MVLWVQSFVFRVQVRGFCVSGDSGIHVSSFGYRV